MSERDDALNTLIRQLTQSAALLIEARIRETMKVAGITADDLTAKRATGERITDQHSRCGGSGVVTTFDHASDRIFATVHLCECLEIKIVRAVADPLGGDGFVHV